MISSSSPWAPSRQFRQRDRPALARSAQGRHRPLHRREPDRAKAKDDLDELLRQRLAPYGIRVDNVSLTQFRFSDTFNQAIEAKVTQEQQALQAKYKLAQVQWEAQQTITRAKADAEALQLKRQNITQTLVEQAFVDKWDDKLPYVMGSSSLTALPAGIFPKERP